MQAKPHGVSNKTTTRNAKSQEQFTRSKPLVLKSDTKSVCQISSKVCWNCGRQTLRKTTSTLGWICRVRVTLSLSLRERKCVGYCFQVCMYARSACSCGTSSHIQLTLVTLSHYQRLPAAPEPCWGCKHDSEMEGGLKITIRGSIRIRVKYDVAIDLDEALAKVC